MKISAATIADANSRMAEIASNESIGDGEARLTKMAEIWQPIADATDRRDVPAAAANLLERLGRDFVGVAVDGGLVAWGQPEPMPGTDRTWRPLVIVGTGRPMPDPHGRPVDPLE